MNKLNRNLWVDYLRATITVMVVAHHSSLAYTTYAWFDKSVYIHSSHAIVDIKRWIGLDILVNFNDIFFMSLMFLIGGLYLIKSINKKGAHIFIKDRLYRLFIPFLFLGTFLMLIAYFPSYYFAHNKADIIAYIKDFFIIEKWPVGPPWFIWLLFFFTLIFALFHSQFQKISEMTGTLLSGLKNRPFTLFIIMFSATWILFVPLAYLVGAGTWTGFGPLDFQLSRILLYFGYFTLGILIGNTDFNNDLFSTKSTIVKKWWLWAILSFTVFSILTLTGEALKQLVQDNKIKEFCAWMIYYMIYAASCTLSCIAFITGFRKIVSSGKYWMDSLSENAYLIYLIHFIFVVWCQLLLLKFDIPAFIKFIVTFIFALSLSWMVSGLLRKIKIINKYL
jgi:glucans biosynthesis protein C